MLRIFASSPTFPHNYNFYFILLSVNNILTLLKFNNLHTTMSNIPPICRYNFSKTLKILMLNKESPSERINYRSKNCQ